LKPIAKNAKVKQKLFGQKQIFPIGKPVIPEKLDTKKMS
jgi:hypothetical protein